MFLSRRMTALFVYSVTTLLPYGVLAQTSCPPLLASPPLVSAGALLAATNPTAAPMQYVDETGKLVGLDIDFGVLIAERLCLKIEWMKTEFAAMIPGLKGGRFDMIDTFMYYTPERAATVHMIPYGAATLAIIVPQSDTASITSLGYFSGKRFGTQLGSTDDKVARAESDELVRAGKAAIDIRTFPNYSDLLGALTAGQLDGAFIGTEQAYFYRDKGQKFFSKLIVDATRPAGDFSRAAQPRCAGGRESARADRAVFPVGIRRLTRSLLSVAVLICVDAEEADPCHMRLRRRT
jgi:ABC-type amino acid transport substrate-binding protein